MYIIINIRKNWGIPHMINKGSLFFTKSDLLSFIDEFSKIRPSKEDLSYIDMPASYYHDNEKIRWEIINLDHSDDRIIKSVSEIISSEIILEKLLEIRIILREQNINKILCT